ncbi:MAG: hypothetical protein ACOYL6_16790 [Bacteriovoracaceae bacterium]
MKMKMMLMGLVLAVTSLSSFAQVETDLGRGISQYDKEAGVKDRCIELKPSDIYSEDARLTTYHLHLVKNKEELYDKITASGSASGSYGVFSASAKASFVKEVKWNHNSNYVLVRAVRVTQKQKISVNNIMLSDYSKKVLLQSRFDFLQSCGTSFANVIRVGGEIYGLIEIHSSSYQEKQRISASIEGSGKYSMGSAKGGADFKETIEKLRESFNCTVSYEHIGGKKIDAPDTIEGLLSLSSKIEAISDAHPVSLDMETREYSTVANSGIVYDPYVVKIRQDTITWAEGKLKLARNLFSQILYILENEKDFKNFSEAELKAKLGYLDEKILDLNAFINKSYNFMNDVDPDQISLDLSINLPAMKRKAQRSELKFSCVEKRTPFCGVESYKEQRSSACNVLGPKVGTGPSCGTVYVEKESEACGVKTYNEAQGSVCGVLRYKQCHSKACGKNWDGSRKRCRTSACGVDVYKSCRDQSFGAQEFNKCRDESHGIEKFLTCAHKDFGYDFESCQHLSHGPDKFNTCEVTKISNQETFCPEF